ncbi:hypothetical protein DFR27_0657 [Umboniibacter marinipuniceus]|uniref:Uncharacterized protein n=1 Tax=Umboniibacter marinipuniceus TaxID=569599 RepID=A0A3M0ACM7_9GAMM|nr:hypothetical protein DFR27_0657 [Umboniibacter marinipuniceus]
MNAEREIACSQINHLRDLKYASRGAGRTDQVFIQLSKTVGLRKETLFYKDKRGLEIAGIEGLKSSADYCQNLSKTSAVRPIVN